MNKKLRNAIKKAENKQNEADLALQSIWEHLAFSGFRDREDIEKAAKIYQEQEKDHDIWAGKDLRRKYERL